MIESTDSPSVSPTIEAFPDGNIVACFDVPSSYCQPGGSELGCFEASNCAKCNYPNSWSTNGLHTCSALNISQRCHDLYPSECLYPTDSPTILPTHLPTKVPTKLPTQNPSDSPTNSPTMEPTLMPTAHPSKSPSNLPSSKTPTASPTDLPTADMQSFYPTDAPSDAPTMRLSDDPTNIPTSKPSMDSTSASVALTALVTMVSTKTPSKIEHEIINDQIIEYMIIIIVLLSLILCCLCCLWIHRLCIKPQTKMKLSYDYDTAIYNMQQNALHHNNSKQLTLQMSEVPTYSEKDKTETDSVRIIEYNTNGNIAEDEFIINDSDENAEYTKGEVYNHLTDDDEATPGSNVEDAVTSEGTGDDDEETQTVGMETLNVYKDEMKEKSSESSYLYLDYDEYAEQRVKDQLEENENILNVYYGTKTKDDHDDDNKIVIELWLKDTVGLPQYLNALVSHGFESMDLIKAIANKNQLSDIGIVNEAHQNILMCEIEKL